jgi:hypothetical protein
VTVGHVVTQVTHINKNDNHHNHTQRRATSRTTRDGKWLGWWCSYHPACRYVFAGSPSSTTDIVGFFQVSRVATRSLSSRPLSPRPLSSRPLSSSFLIPRSLVSFPISRSVSFSRSYLVLVSRLLFSSLVSRSRLPSLVLISRLSFSSLILVP